MRKWKPYANPRDPVWTAVTGMYPTDRGTYKSASGFAAIAGAGAGPSAPGVTRNAWCAVLPNGVSVGYVGTTGKLYRTADFVSFTDASATTYNNGATGWSFAQFGNFTLASNGVDQIQVRDATGTSAFANLGGSPPSTAAFLVVQSNAVLAFNLNSGGNEWAASDVGDHTNWTTGEAVTATKILHRPGNITAAIAFRDVVLVFKRSSVYVMRYVGAPEYWIVELLTDSYGCRSQHDVVNCGDYVVFIGDHGAALWDGSQFRDIDDGFELSTTGSALWAGTATVAWNPDDLATDLTLSNSNATVSSGNTASSSVSRGVRAAEAKASGKWYFEVVLDARQDTISIGLASAAATLSGSAPVGQLGNDANGIGYRNVDGGIIKGGSPVGSGSIYGFVGVVIGVAYDAGAGTVRFYFNNSLQATISGSNVPTGPLYPAISIDCAIGNTTTLTLRTASAAFSYTPPAGYLAWGGESSNGSAGSNYWPAERAASFHGGALVKPIMLYNMRSDAWGNNNVVNSSGTAWAGYVPLVGEPAARRAILGSSATLNGGGQLYVNLSKNPTTIKSGTNVQSAGASSVTTGFIGLGDKVMTRFDRVQPILIDSYPDFTAVATGGLRLSATASSNTDSGGVDSAFVTNQASSTKQHEFNLTATRRWAEFTIDCGSSGGFWEIQDVLVDMHPAGQK